MNFLSHYYLDRDKSDPFYTIGLITPDLLTLHRGHIRVKEKNILQIVSGDPAPSNRSLAAGMLCHVRIDRWFHGHELFKSGQEFIGEFGRNGGFVFSMFMAHILYEILLDRYIAFTSPDYESDFYEECSAFNFNKTVPFLSRLENFDRDGFIGLTDRFCRHKYALFYKKPEDIIDVVNNISSRFLLAGIPKTDYFIDGMEFLYEKFINDFKSILSARSELPFSKEKLAEML